MPSINIVTIGGHLGRDAEVKFTQAGKPWTRFSVAVTEKYKQGDEWKKQTVWVNCIWWSAYEDAGVWLTKGRGVVVTGKLAESNYKKPDGTEVKSFEVKVDHCYPVESFERERSAPQQAALRNASEDSAWENLGDVPF